MTTWHRILIGDVLDGLRSMDAGSCRCCVTSPPYWGLRDYGMDGQIGMEPTPEAFVARLVEVFREVRRVLTDDGTLWLNLGSSAAQSGMGGNPAESEHRKQATNAGSLIAGRKVANGFKPKDMVPIPWMVAMALQSDGWYLRQDIIWAKPNPMPESVSDRCTKAHEYVFLLSKRERYYYDAEAIAEPSAQPWRAGTVERSFSEGDPSATLRNDHGREILRTDTRNARSVWTIATQPFPEAHFATFPEELPRRCILAGSSEKGKCPACGKPWVRVDDGNAWAAAVRATKWTWKPTCECGGEPVPDTILDPFVGSGTTLAVARTLGRNGIGCELNSTYAAIAEDRIGRTVRPNTHVSQRADHAPLFGVAP